MTGTTAGNPTVRSLRRSLAVAAGSAMVALLLCTPVHAADDSAPLLELSRDGVHYAPERLVAVFGSTAGYVPGESRSGVVWVRNASSRTSHFSLAVANTGPGSDSAMAGYLQLGAASPQWSATAGIPSRAGACTALVDGWKLAGGDSLRIELDLAFDVTAPNSTRHQESHADVLFLLQDLEGGRSVSPCAIDTRAGGTSMGAATINSSTEANQSFATAAGQPGPQEEMAPGAMRPEAQGPQSNVVAISRSPWPWLMILSSGTYMGISLRRQRRAQ